MPTIMETIAADPSLKTLKKALGIVGGVRERLERTGTLTFFAPNDEAFARLNMEQILGDTAKLTDILNYHLVGEKHFQKEMDVKNLDSLVTELGKSLSIYLDENEIMIDNAHLITTDIECSNGVIHIIDNVFLPQHSGWYETLA
ncbi:MAG: fasciclin domain-containing protein [Pedobacter sp.]